MKVKHSVETDDMEADELYSMVTGICLTNYSTVEEQSATILSAKTIFKGELDKLILKAFEIGCKIGESKANTKDAVMYDAAY